MNLTVVHSELRPVIQRLTEIEILREDKSVKVVYAYETIGNNGKSYDKKIQNWECEDITDTFDESQQKEIFNACKSYWKTVE